MAQNSEISWTHHTFNPWSGCTKVSDGCKFCYAETLMDKRYGKTKWGPNGTRVVKAESGWREPLKWDKWAADGTCWACGGKGTIAARTKLDAPTPCATCAGTGDVGPYRARVFCASLADVAEGRDTMPVDSWEPIQTARRRLGQTIDATPHLDYLLLTKRPENIPAVLDVMFPNGFQPRPNIWWGTSVENQAAADKRHPLLRAAPAAVRFYSAEPLVGPIDNMPLDGIGWVIVGAESGHDARPMHPAWAQSIRDQCVTAGVAFHFKQWGEWGPLDQVPGLFARRTDPDIGPKLRWPWGIDGPGVAGVVKLGKHATGRLLDGRTWDELPKPATV